jgi:hypothetical protein
MQTRFLQSGIDRSRVMLVGWIRIRLFNIAQEALVVKHDVEK